MTFYLPASYYEPPDEHDCPYAINTDCRCEQDAEDRREAALLARDDADRGR